MVLCINYEDTDAPSKLPSARYLFALSVFGLQKSKKALQNHSPFDENWSSLFLNSRLNVVSEP